MHNFIHVVLSCVFNCILFHFILSGIAALSALNRRRSINQLASIRSFTVLLLAAADISTDSQYSLPALQHTYHTSLSPPDYIDVESLWDSRPPTSHCHRTDQLPAWFLRVGAPFFLNSFFGGHSHMTEYLGQQSTVQMINKRDEQRVDAFLPRHKKCGLCQPDLPTFQELLLLLLLLLFITPKQQYSIHNKIHTIIYT